MSEKNKDNLKQDADLERILQRHNKEEFWQNSTVKIEEFANSILEEIRSFELLAGELPSDGDRLKYKNLGALWVVSGGGSYLSLITNSPSDQKNKNKPWYFGQDKARLDYSLSFIRILEKLFSTDIKLIYNGTPQQNSDLVKAIDLKKCPLEKSDLYIAPGRIARTIDQVKEFSFPVSFLVKSNKLAILSHSAHLPRILRFMSRFPKRFKKVRIIPVSLNASDQAGQKEMTYLELDNLLGCISRGEALTKPYPFDRKLGSEEIEILPITKKDVLDVLNLSNQKSVRAVSFNSQKIKLSDHKKWFARKLKDKNTIMLKAAMDGVLAGQIRLDIEETKALIGVSVSEDFRGRGIATKLIKAAIARAKRRNLKIIEAFIKPDNQASIGLFEKNGWVFMGQEMKSKTLANKYYYKLQKK